MNKLEGFVTRRTMGVINSNKQYELKQKFNEVSKFYKNNSRVSRSLQGLNFTDICVCKQNKLMKG